MVPEISSVIDKIFCHFGQVFAHLPPKNLKNENFKTMKKTQKNWTCHQFTQVFQKL